MIFEEIVIDNLFAYYGPNRFDLSGVTEDANVVLISGRNGYGKTTFLNSIKLLFGGVTDSLRGEVQRGRKPTPRQYIMGAGDDWLGVMNIQARIEGQTSCGVRVAWREERGRVELTRSWEIRSHDFDGNVRLEADFLNTPLTQKDDDEISRFLSERIPQSYIPYFFFDGEQIQQIAEANWHAQQQHMERLLNIAPIDKLIESIGYVISDLKRDALDQKDKATLIEFENDLAELNAQADAKQQVIDDLSSEIDDLESRLQYLIRNIEGMTAFRNQADEVKLKQEKEDLEDQRIKLQGKIMERLPRAIPIHANLDLVERAEASLRKIIDSESGVQSELLRKLALTLPSQIFDMPPYPPQKLTTGQADFYRNRLKNVILSFQAKPEHWTDAVLKTDVSKAKQTINILTHYLHSKSFVSAIAEDFRHLRTIKAKLTDINAKLENIKTFSADEQALYEKRIAEKKQIEQTLTDKKADLKKNISDQKAINTEAGKKTEQIEQQQKIYQKSQKARKKVKKADLLKNFFNSYKSELKKLRRQEIEEAVNRYFPQLMTSQGMIKKIEIGDDFDLHYIGANHQRIGMGSLSAGTKQLIATSLLWALKDVSHKEIPLIVDTPLARIDRNHQENLLVRYYPKAAHQVIILPTDSEIDETKYRILEPHIYREYVLQNPTGYKTKAVEEKMYPRL